MRLTVLGSAASFAGAGQACSGHLVATPGANILFDCGHGVVANLAEAIDPLALDAVFITHAHVDHFVDLYALQALMRYAPEGPAGPLPLYAPAGLFERMGCLLSDSGRGELSEAFTVHELIAGVDITIGDLVVTPYRIDHIDPTFALVAHGTGPRLCYTADTAMTQPVMDAADECDLLLAEATLPQRFADAAPHLTAAQAGEIAQQAGASALVLVHIWPTNDRERALEEARSAFDGEVLVANEMDTFELFEEDDS